MFTNNGMGMGMNPAMGAMGGYAYNGMAQPVQKFNNPLTPEQIKRLQQKQDQFSLGLTEEEMLRGVCNHRNAEGTGDALVFDPVTGVARCTICGYQFRPVEANVTPEEIRDDVDRIVDILQTIKLMYIDLPAEAAMEYFQIIPLISKIPQLFEFAAKNMAKHETFNWQYNNRNMGTMTMFQNLQNMFAGGAMNPNMGMQMGMAPQQPGYGFNPAMGMAPQMSAPVAPTNGFGYPGASMAAPQAPAYNPAVPNYQFTPNPAMSTMPVAPTTPVAPEAPAAQAAETTVTQTVNP